MPPPRSRWVVAALFVVACSVLWVFVPSISWIIVAVAPLLVGLGLGSWWALLLAPAGVVATLAVIVGDDALAGAGSDRWIERPVDLVIVAVIGLLLFGPLLSALAAVGVSVRKLGERLLASAHGRSEQPSAGPRLG